MTILGKIIVTILVIAFVAAAGFFGLLIYAADEMHCRLRRDASDGAA